MIDTIVFGFLRVIISILTQAIPDEGYGKKKHNLSVLPYGQITDVLLHNRKDRSRGKLPLLRSSQSVNLFTPRPARRRGRPR